MAGVGSVGVANYAPLTSGVGFPVSGVTLAGGVSYEVGDTGVVSECWSPIGLFTQPGVPGALDFPLAPYQDSAVPPVTPASAVGDPIGTIVSQVSGGFNWRQTIAGNKMTAGNLPRGGVRNRQLNSDAFVGTGWSSLTGGTITGGQGASPVGTYSSFTESSATSQRYIRGNDVPAGVVVLSRYVKAGSGAQRYLCLEADESAGSGLWRVFFNPNTGAITSTTGTGATSGVVDYGGGSYRVWLKFTAPGTCATYTYLTNSPTGVAGYLGDGSSNILMSGAMNEVSADITPYQNVTNAYTITQSGVPTLQMPYFDGNDYAALSVNGTGVQELSSTADFFATAGHSWAIGLAWSTFIGGFSTLFAKCGATAGNRTFQFLLSSGVISAFARGTETVLGSGGNTGTINTALIVCDNGVITAYINNSAAVVLTIGAAAEESEVVTMGCRTESLPAGFYTGFLTTPALLGYAPSAAQIAQYMSQQRAYWGAP